LLLLLLLLLLSMHPFNVISVSFMSIPSVAFSVVLFKLSLHLAFSHILNFSVSVSFSFSTHEALRLMGHGLA
jgi:hypothetical protein